MAKSKNSSSLKSVVDWFRAHPIVSHLLAIVLVLACLAVLAFVIMALGTRHDARRTVPDFVGLTIDDAHHFASRRDLEIAINDSLYVPAYPGGVVLDQLPAGGTIVKPGRKIYVTINSKNQRKVAVPYVAGRSLRQAKNMLETAGFAIERLEFVEDIATNYVLAQFVQEEEVLEDTTLEALVGSGVVLQVGVAPDASDVLMPKVLGLSLHEAKSRVLETGLNLDLHFDLGIQAHERSQSKVYQQSVEPKAELKRGEAIALHLTLDQAKVDTAIVLYERRVAEELRLKMEADSLAEVERRMLDSIANAQKAQQPTAPQAEDNFFF